MHFYISYCHQWLINDECQSVMRRYTVAQLESLLLAIFEGYDDLLVVDPPDAFARASRQEIDYGISDITKYDCHWLPFRLPDVAVPLLRPSQIGNNCD